MRYGSVTALDAATQSATSFESRASIHRYGSGDLRAAVVVDDVPLARGRIGELAFRWIGGLASKGEKRKQHGQ